MKFAEAVLTLQIIIESSVSVNIMDVLAMIITHYQSFANRCVMIFEIQMITGRQHARQCCYKNRGHSKLRLQAGKHL
jgi:hypothetical protein